MGCKFNGICILVIWLNNKKINSKHFHETTKKENHSKIKPENVHNENKFLEK